jgi:hypothetical protein
VRYLIVLTFFLGAACGHANTTQASRCYVVGVGGDANTRIIELLDAFAQNNDLRAEKSHPANATYQRIVDGHVVVEIMYTVGVAGPRGSVLTAFVYGDDPSEPLLASLDSFAQQVLAQSFAMQECSELPDFQNPVVVR